MLVSIGKTNNQENGNGASYSPAMMETTKKNSSAVCCKEIGFRGLQSSLTLKQKPEHSSEE